MTVAAWLAFCLTTAVLCVTPGPAVLFVVSTALARGGPAGMAAAGGILAANALWLALAWTGIVAALAASPAAFTALAWAGAAYLGGLGLRMLVGTPAAAAAPAPPRRPRAFGGGLLVQAANPGAPLFFLAFLPQFVDPAGAVGRQLVVLGGTSLAIELAVLALYVQLGVRTRDLVGGRLAWVERIGGALLIAACARLALVRAG